MTGTPNRHTSHLHVTSKTSQIIIGVFTLDTAAEVLRSKFQSLRKKSKITHTHTHRVVLGVLLIFWLCHNQGWASTKEWWMAHLLWQVSDHLSLFQVGFSVQVGGFDVTDPIWVGWVKQHHIGRNYLITAQMHHVTHKHISPAPLHIALLFTATQTNI